MAWFPNKQDRPGATGSLVFNKDFYQPSESGTLIYLSCDDLSTEQSKTEPAGGKIVVPKRMISPDYGFMGVILDSEGNRIALHSLK
jgi:predicted enzyme related to lactoylglutathione lyase